MLPVAPLTWFQHLGFFLGSVERGFGLTVPSVRIEEMEVCCAA